MNCQSLLSTFLLKSGIEENSYNNAFRKLSLLGLSDSADVDYPQGEQVIIRVLTDIYALNSQKVKLVANIISKQYTAVGRYEKALIKHFLDYEDEPSFKELLASLSEIGVEEDYLTDLLKTVHEDFSALAISSLKSNWELAENNGDESKKFDYLQGIYTKLIALLNEDILSLHDIFEYNETFIKEEFDANSVDRLRAYCNDQTAMPSARARKLFCDKYDELLTENLQVQSANNMLEPVMNQYSAEGTIFESYKAEQFKLVVINIDQMIYNEATSEEAFWDKVLSLIYYAYRVLDNHRTLAINVNNIYTEDGRNLKWMVYSYIGIYAEHFIPCKEHRRFYKPDELSIAKADYTGRSLYEYQKETLSDYFAGRASIDDVAKVLNCSKDEAESLVLDFENIWYGYMFSDCISIISGEYQQNQEIQFIKNNNQILLLFNKYRHDERKIPCPECAGLDISGNSYPEVGLKSWECKNVICPSRSKSNRGKRYSKKSNFMQWGFELGSDNDQISRSLIKKWRRDIVKINDQNEIYDMLTRYFTFDNEDALFINLPRSIESVVLACHRKAEIIEPEAIKQTSYKSGLYNDYFAKGGYVARYLDQIVYHDGPCDEVLTDKIKSCGNSVLINGDSRSVLAKISENTITAAVTSPPYYNARLYSQWPNLYLYLSDMYEIIKQTYRTMKPGGVYLYNIGDICGNENTIVRSTMGNKRILLGAYTIHLFTSAGFELLDNLLWDKGEPQSNRQKNDGKFTPFYQKPMNVYEHMFLFKKPGAPAIIKDDVAGHLPIGWDANIVPFSPVIKINCKGENTLGHTAPFPLDIPEFVAKVFTRSQSDIVLEPFAGSGTSLIAASREGVKSLGIELCDEYVSLIHDICEENDVTITEIK